MSEITKKFNIKAQVTHLALHVKDVHKSAAFYKEWAGMDIVASRDTSKKDNPVIWIAGSEQADDFVIVLVPGGEGANDNEAMRHIGLSVSEKGDVKKLAERAEKAGILHWEHQDHGFPVGILCGIKDPDGHIVEFSYGQPLGPDFAAQKKAGKNSMGKGPV